VPTLPTGAPPLLLPLLEVLPDPPLLLVLPLEPVPLLEPVLPPLLLPPLLLPLLDPPLLPGREPLLLPPLLLLEPAPQTPPRGTHALTACPLDVLSGVHAWSDAQPVAIVHAAAQYVSPAN
jgi:hypothetical protein